MAEELGTNMRPARNVRWWPWEPRLFAAVAVLQTAPVLIFRYFPSWDGSAHTATAVALNNYDGVFEQYFARDWFPVPNMAQHWILVALTRVFSPLTSEKLLVLLIMISLPFAARYAIRAVRPSGAPLAWLVFPFAIGHWVQIGFYDFALGLSLFFVTLGYWLKHRDRLTPAAVGALLALLTATYFCHIVDFMMAVGFIAVQLFWTTVVANHDWRTFRRRAGLALVAMSPAFALLIAYFAFRSEKSAYAWLPPKLLIERLARQFGGIAAFTTKEHVVGFFLTATFVALAVYAAVKLMPRNWRAPQNAFLAAGLATLVMYFTVPDMLGTGGGELTARLSVFLLFALLLWLAALDPPQQLKMGVIAAAVIASLALTIIRIPTYRAFDRDITEFVSAAPVLKPGSTVVPVFFVTDIDNDPGVASATYTRPMEQAAGYLMAERQVVDLSHFEAFFPYFPLQWRDGLNPLGRIGNNWIATATPRVDLLGYERKTAGRGRIDYVVVWGRAVATEKRRNSAAARAIDRQLAEGYRLIFTSKPRGRMQVYERKER